MRSDSAKVRCATAVLAGGANGLYHCPSCDSSSTSRQPCLEPFHFAGSFGVTVETAILPALTGMAAAIDDGQNHLEALASAVPSLLNASSLAMPCRAMCEVRCLWHLASCLAGAGPVPMRSAAVGT